MFLVQFRRRVTLCVVENSSSSFVEHGPSHALEGKQCLNQYRRIDDARGLHT